MASINWLLSSSSSGPGYFWFIQIHAIQFDYFKQALVLSFGDFKGNFNSRDKPVNAHVLHLAVHQE